MVTTRKIALVLTVASMGNLALAFITGDHSTISIGVYMGIASLFFWGVE
jgi:lipopolysaccharide export LptBFGC system permease protein LptF